MNLSKTVNSDTGREHRAFGQAAADNNSVADE